MAMRWNTFPLEITGGLVKNLTDIRHGILQPGSAVRMINFEPSIEGGVRRINGYEKFDPNVIPSADSATQLLGVAFFDGDVIVPREGKIYSSSGSGWTEIATGRTQTTKQRFHIFNFDGTRKLIGVDGVNYPWTWDKTTFTDLTGSADIEGTSHVVEFKDHLFFAKGNLVTFCAPFDETDFNAGNGAGSFRVDNDITGMVVFRDRLFVFSQDKIAVLDGSSSSDFRLTSVSEKVGCAREDTIQQVSGDIAFLSFDGVRMLGATDRIGDFSNRTASSQIQQDFTYFINTFENFASVVIRDKSQYRVFGSSVNLARTNCGGYVGTQFEPQNSQSFQWGELKEIKVFAADSQVYEGDEYQVFVYQDSEYVYRMESGGSFDGSVIKSYYWTPYISFTDTTKRKTFYKVDTFISAESALDGTFQLSLDQGTATRPQPVPVNFSTGGVPATWDDFVWGSFDWSTGDEDTRISTQVVGTGFTAALQYSFEQDSQPFVIDSIFVEFTEEDRK